MQKIMVKMKRKKIQVKCVECGKVGTALISKIRKRITSDFGYFGVIDFTNSDGVRIQTEYWECPDCEKRGIV